MLEMYFAITSVVVIVFLYDLYRYSKDSLAEEHKAIRRIRRKYIASSGYNCKTYSSPGLVSTVSLKRKEFLHKSQNYPKHGNVRFTSFFDIG